MSSRNKKLALFLILSIILVCGFFYILNISYLVKEGFSSSSKLQRNYATLQSKLQSTLGPYCSLTNFIQDQMKTMYQATKVSESGESVPGDSDIQATANIKKAYQDAYACKDELADSRQSCAGFAKFEQINVKMDFIPCSVYMNTPAYDESDTSLAAIALSQIPDNLALRINKEIDWYAAILKKLQSGIDEGAKPPKELPPGAPGADYKAPPDKSAPSGAPTNKEAFADIIEGFTLLNEGFKSKFSNIKDTVKSAVKKTGGAVASVAKKTGGAVASVAKKTGGAVTSVAKKAGGAVASAAAGAAKKAGGAVVSAAKKTGGAVAGAAKKTGGAVAGAAAGAAKKVGGAVAAVTAVAGAITAKIKNPFRNNAPICSADAAREKRERERREKLEKESKNCRIKGLQTEIDRVNGILNSDALKSAVARCAAIADAAQKLQSQLALLKAGNLYDWQKSGPTKSYAQFKGGDRIAALTFSLQQNRG